MMNDPLTGRGQGHVTYCLNFGTPSVTFERVKLDTSFFCWIGHGEYYPTGDERPLRGRGQGHSYFLNFGTPSVTFERVKLDTSFFLC